MEAVLARRRDPVTQRPFHALIGVCGHVRPCLEENRGLVLTNTGKMSCGSGQRVSIMACCLLSQAGDSMALAVIRQCVKSASLVRHRFSIGWLDGRADCGGLVLRGLLELDGRKHQNRPCCGLRRSDIDGVVSR